MSRRIVTSPADKICLPAYRRSHNFRSVNCGEHKIDFRSAETANLWRILTANSSNSATSFFTSLLRPGRIANVHFYGMLKAFDRIRGKSPLIFPAKRLGHSDESRE
jgi:hypothetical protein